ncbi:MAG TPA: hypothetical protein VK688_13235, partial [Gemmatimonadales bacterium]|nr:hypothetical protein [Gemmatimonadales bacterium]
LYIAHFVDQPPTGTNFGDVEVLPPTIAGFLDCSTQIGSATAKPRSLAAASWHAVTTQLGSFAKVLFLPPELHATILLGGGPGGFTGKFSPFGTVDINSNPAKLSIVNSQGAPASGFVSGPGQVFVKATSAGAHYPGSYLLGAYTSPNPIPGVPVNFGGTIVTTDANGIASFNWVPSGPGATLTATAPNEAGCPTAPTPPITAPYRPSVCFTPNSVTFAVQAPAPPAFGATGWTFSFAGGTCFSSRPTTTSTNVFGALVDLGTDDCLSGLVFPSAWQTSDLSSLTTWQTGTAAFGNTGVAGGNPTSISGCPADAAATLWPVNTVLLLRRDFFVPAGTSSATIKVSIDNDVQVFLNGTALTGSANSLVIHDGCSSTASPFTFTVPVGQGGLQIGNNKLAVEALDRGGDTFFDAQITLQGN